MLISNFRFIKNYAIIKNIFSLLLLSGIPLLYFNEIEVNPILSFFIGTVAFGALVFMLIEQISEPSVLEVQSQEYDGILVRFMVPDFRYFFWVRRGQLNEILLSNPNQLKVQLKPKVFGLFQLLEWEIIHQHRKLRIKTDLNTFKKKDQQLLLRVFGGA